jgi:hypothetical protein
MVDRPAARARTAAATARRVGLATLARTRELAGRPGWVLGLRSVWVVAVSLVSLPSPLQPVRFVVGGDTSWKVGLILAARDHLQWGTQVVWTYGPLGYLDSTIPILFRQWVLAVAVTVALQVAFVAVAAVLLTIWRAPLWAWLVLAVLMVLPNSALGTPDLIGLLLAVCLSALALEPSVARNVAAALAAAAGVVLATVALIKGTSLEIGTAVILLVILLAAVRRRPAIAAAAGLGFAGGLAGLWTLAGQDLQNLPAFVRSTLELSSGYSAAMALGGSRPLLGLGVALILATAVGALVAWRLRAGSVLRLILLLLPVVVLEFKEGLVRLDAVHKAGFFSVIVLAAGILVAATASTRMTRGRRGFVATSLVAAALSASFLVGSGMPVPLLGAGTTIQRYQSAWSVLTDPAQRSATLSASRAAARGAYDLPPALLAHLGTGTVDILPFDIELAYGYGLDWDPRPVLQSYSAYTPYLDGSDAAHFASPNGPDHVLLADEAIDGLYPVFQEPATFRALLQHYRATEWGTGAFLVLSRAGQGAANGSGSGVLEAGTGTPDGTACGLLGATLPVPERPGQYTFASLLIPYSLSGEVQDVLYKPADLDIQFVVGSGATVVTSPYRLIPATAADGVFVSGFIADQGDLTQAFGGVITTPVDGLRITSPDATEYRGSVCASFSTIPIAP